MYLIADSGSTKCDWMLVDANGTEVQSFSTMGFNPFFHDEKIISDAIFNNKELAATANQVELVFLYSAGCSSRDLKLIVERALQMVFKKANVYVDHDLVAAAFATYDGRPGISCIIGTGSNSCFFDGDNVSEEVPALGYILGDEGSGSYFGKRLLTHFLYNKLPAPMQSQLQTQYKLTKDVIFENVYMKPHANVYLASFMRVFSDNKELSYVREMVAEGMRDFLLNHVCCFKNHQKVPVHFIGSIAYHFEEILRAEAEKLNITVGKIIQKPIYGLVDYHMKYLIKHKTVH
jgi:glucosamine kinase